MNPAPRATEAANKYFANVDLPPDVKAKATELVALVLAEAGEKIDKLRSALTMVREELCFGGDWENARRIATEVLGDKKS